MGAGGGDLEQFGSRIQIHTSTSMDPVPVHHLVWAAATGASIGLAAVHACCLGLCRCTHPHLLTYIHT